MAHVGTFKRHDDINQGFLFPPSPRDWLPDGHLSWFISDTIDELELDGFLDKYRFCGKGEQAYPPRVMLKILLYAYSVGMFSSRKIAAALYTDVPLRVLGSGLFPDFRTICRFRNKHGYEFASLFAQVVQIAKGAGLVKVGTIAVDGSKVKANASRHKAMSYGRMTDEEKRLKREIRKIVAASRKQDELEVDEFGPDFRGDELPAELSRRETRLKTIRDAKKRLEARKAQEAEEQDARKAREAEEDGRDPPEERPGGRKHPKGEPKPTDQENFTDPDSRMMCLGKKGKSFEQSYNAQIAVDAHEQIIVASWISQCGSDAHHLVPTVEQAENNTGQRPRRVLADSGYRDERELRRLRERGVDAYVAVGREGKESSRRFDRSPEVRSMIRKLAGKRGRATYKKRKHVVEPAFGWIKSVLGFRQFSLRGLAKVRAEWQIVCTAMNLRRMAERLEWV
jgi:transposase